jgi:hypothetical protein
MKCRNGKHELVDILSNSYSYGTHEVVRWCEECGAIVVDREVDGRVQPGNIMKMRIPNYLLKQCE